MKGSSWADSDAVPTTFEHSRNVVPLKPTVGQGTGARAPVATTCSVNAPYDAPVPEKDAGRMANA